MPDLSPQQFSPAMMPKRKPSPVSNAPEGFTLHPHAAQQATAKGFSHADVLRAANDPTISYENGRYPGQMRHIRDNIVAVVEPNRKLVRTVYENVTETKLRTDQTDKDARRYGRRTGQQ